jgi:hypothetical protein
MAKRKSQSEHDQLVKKIAEYLVDKAGYFDVKADIEGYDRPTKIIWSDTKTGHIPDVTASNSPDVIIEVETDDSINDSHTESQWKLFSANSEQHNKQFLIVVPKGSKSKGEERVEELGISAEIVEI